MYEIFISLRFDFLCIYHYILQDNFLKLDLITSIISKNKKYIEWRKKNFVYLIYFFQNNF